MFVCLLVCLFDLLLYVQDKHLRLCLRLNMTEKLFTGTLNHNQNKNKTEVMSGDGQFFDHTVQGHASQRQFTSIWCPFFPQKLTTCSSRISRRGKRMLSEFLKHCMCNILPFESPFL